MKKLSLCKLVKAKSPEEIIEGVGVPLPRMLEIICPIGLSITLT